MEGKWSVVEADDGKEPARFTASNMHLGMVAMLEKKPRRKYKKKKPPSPAFMTEPPLPPPPQEQPSAESNRDEEEDLFLACLAKQQ